MKLFCIIILSITIILIFFMESRISFSFSFKSKVLFFYFHRLSPITFLPQQINKNLIRRKRKNKYLTLFNLRSSAIFCTSTHNWKNNWSNEASCFSRSRRLIGKQLHGSTVWSALHCSSRSVARSQGKRNPVIRSF